MKLSKNAFYKKKCAAKLILLNEKRNQKRNSIDCWQRKLALKMRFWHFLTTQHYINLQNKIISFMGNDFWPKTFLILYPSTSHITRVVSSSVRICRNVVNFWTSCPWSGACTFPVIQKYKHIRNYFEMLKYIYNKGYKESSKKVFPSSKKFFT